MTEFQPPFDLTDEYRRSEEARLYVVEIGFRAQFPENSTDLAWALEFLNDKRARLAKDPGSYYDSEVAMKRFLSSASFDEGTER